MEKDKDPPPIETDLTQNRFVIFMGHSNRPVVDRIERSGISDQGLRQTTELRLSVAGCGHTLHTGEEIGGRCGNPACRALLCARCSAGRCIECGRAFCPHCRKDIFISDNDKYVCLQHADAWLG